MTIKKSFLILLIFLAIPLISAELKIEKQAVSDAIVPELSQPAVFDLEITNLKAEDIFRIYSLVGVNIKPNESFSIKQNETKEVRVELWPDKKILETPGTFPFIYKISGDKAGVQEDTLTIRIVSLKDAININSYNLNLDTEKAVVYAKNMIGLEFLEIKASFHSSFFDFSRNFSLGKYEKKEFPVDIDRQAIRKLEAGEYTITTDIETFGVKEKITGMFKYTEKPDILTTEDNYGFFISRKVIEKMNNGNIPMLVQVTIKKNIITRLLTSFNTNPSTSERAGFSVTYTFQKEIKPSETFTVKATTNWFYPLIIIIAILVVAFIVKIYISTHLSLVKKAGFVKTKGGEFALKITLILKAKKFAEKIKVVDKIPSLVKIYERFGTIQPDKIDEKNKRLEWNIDLLQPGEERVFSYIIYSKVSPFGKFELPPAMAVYEREGKMQEAESNKVFFMTEPRKPAED